MKKTIILASVFLTIVLSAQVTELNKVTDWKGSGCILKDDALAFSGRWSYVSSIPLIKIDPAAQYIFEFEFKGPEKPSKPLKITASVTSYDKNKKIIQPYHVLNVAGSEAKLSREAKIGDHELWLKDADAGKWSARPWASIAFNAKENYADLPNRDIVNRNIRKIETSGNELKISLKTPMKKAYPAGTRVRQHIWSSDVIVFTAPVNSNWTKKAGTVTGLLGVNPYEKGRFWRGAVYFRPAFSVSPVTKDQVQIKNVRLTIKTADSIF